MYYGNIKNCDVANGLGVRVSLFVSGCTNHCEHCFQPETWSFQYGKPFTAETEERILALLAPEYIGGLTVLGGEPFEPENQQALLPFLRRVRQQYPSKTIWCYSGFTWEELHDPAAHPCRDTTAPMLALLDVLVDGRFVEAKKDLTLVFRGSANQRIIDVPKTLSAGVVTLWDVTQAGKGK